MNAFFRLELRKNALLFAGLIGAFLLSLPLSGGAAAMFRDTPPGEILKATLMFWCLLGVPGAALFLGGNAGSGLRANAETEQLLPLSPRQRASAALFGSVVYAAAITLVVFSATLLLMPDWQEQLISYSTAPDRNPFLEPVLFLALFAVLYGLLTSAVCAYAFGNSLFGALSGGALALTSTGLLGLGFIRQVMVMDREVFFSPTLLAMAAALAGGAAALAVLAPWLERSQPFHWKRAAVVAAGLLAGVLTGNWVQNHTYWIEAQGLRSLEWGGRKEGALMRDLRGGLVWVQPTGGRVQQIPVHDNPSIYNPYSDPAWEDDGTFWILRRVEPYSSKMHELWHGRPGERLALHTRFHYNGSVELGTHNGRKVLEAGEGPLLEAALPPKDAQPRFSEVPHRQPRQLSGHQGGRTPDGAQWEQTPRLALQIVEQSGRTLPLVPIVELLNSAGKGTPHDARVARVSDDLIWVVAAFSDPSRRLLVKIDTKAMRLLQSWDLPDRTGITYDAGDSEPVAIGHGLLVLTARRLYLVDWEGKARLLGKA